MADIELAGMAEAADIVGVSKSNFSAHRAKWSGEDECPEPTAQLVCGPVWAGPAVKALRKWGERFAKVRTVRTPSAPAPKKAAPKKAVAKKATAPKKAAAPRAAAPPVAETISKATKVAASTATKEAAKTPSSTAPAKKAAAPKKQAAPKAEGAAKKGLFGGK